MNERDTRAYRLHSIDLVRGVAIVLMALDHTRDFFSNAQFDIFADLSQTPLVPFLTRWVTHFCAPTFVFLAGVSAGLTGARRGTSELSRFLVQRGVWLVLIEVAVVSFAWTFGRATVPGGTGTVLILQVIFAIGAAMVALAGLVWLPRGLLLPIGIGIVVGHNLLDGVWPAATFLQTAATWWHGLHNQTVTNVGGLTLMIVYPLLPWIGVITMGYCMAQLFTRPEGERRTALVRAGAVMIAAFLLLRGLHLYGEPNAWAPVLGSLRGSVVDFLDTTKYPPSLQYVLMTLGPAFVLLAFADRWRGRLGNVLATFGRVPFLFYVAHLYLLRLGAFIVGAAQGFSAADFAVFYDDFPAGFGFGLPGVYTLWLVVVGLLYFPCAWFSGVKKRRRDWWLSYL